MISLDIDDRELRAILEKELPLSPGAIFLPRTRLQGTQIYEHALFTIDDGEITWILIRGTFVLTDVYVLIRTDLPEEFQFYRLAGELGEIGLDPRKVRLVCIAVNISETVPGASRYPEIQIIRVPF